MRKIKQIFFRLIILNKIIIGICSKWFNTQISQKSWWKMFYLNVIMLVLVYFTSTFGLNVALCMGWLTSSAVQRVGACSHGAGAGGASAQGRGLGAETLIACVSSWGPFSVLVGYPIRIYSLFLVWYDVSYTTCFCPWTWSMDMTLIPICVWPSLYLVWL